MRSVYIISDLHIGGEGGPDGQRGFRMNTRAEELARFVDAVTDAPGAADLVINGDIVDFLAERSDEPGSATDTPRWIPFDYDQASVVRKLERIRGRNAAFFESLRRLQGAANKRLLLVLGNHDLELSLPGAREWLAEVLGGEPRCFFDNEALIYGRCHRALIEHGNRYDAFNSVDHDGLRRVRSLMSRDAEKIAQVSRFSPPPGSRLVCEVMNPQKENYSFVDLLKPEIETVLPLLLALEPSTRSTIKPLGKIAADSIGRGAEGDTPRILSNVSGMPLVDRIATALGFNADKLAGRVGLAMLLAGDGDSQLADRLPILRDALRLVTADQSFAESPETWAPAVDAVSALWSRGFEYVVFGHTHLAKDVAHPTGTFRYLNTGTWADLIQLPWAGRKAGPSDGELTSFVDALRGGNIDGYVVFRPTYVRLDLDSSAEVVGANLCTWSPLSRSLS